MDNQKQIDRLRGIINDPNKSQKLKDQAQTQLDRLTAIGGVQIASVQSGASTDPTAQAIIDAITLAMNQGTTSIADIQREIEEVLKYRKIDIMTYLLMSDDENKKLGFILFDESLTFKGVFCCRLIIFPASFIKNVFSLPLFLAPLPFASPV